MINCLAVGLEEVQEVGLALCHNPLIRKISFTGSTNVGKWLMREGASTVKRVRKGTVFLLPYCCYLLLITITLSTSDGHISI